MVSEEEEIERPPFDINLAVILAGFAFEAYISPPVIVLFQSVYIYVHNYLLFLIFLQSVYFSFRSLDTAIVRAPVSCVLSVCEG